MHKYVKPNRIIIVRNDPETGVFGQINVLELPPKLTGVRIQIVGLVVLCLPLVHLYNVKWPIRLILNRDCKCQTSGIENEYLHPRFGAPLLTRTYTQLDFGPLRL